MVKHVFLCSHFTWIELKNSAESIFDAYRIAELLASFSLGSVLLKGDYTAANRDALSSTSFSSGGVDTVIKRTCPYKEVLRLKMCAVHLLDIYYNYLWLH